MGQLHVDPEIAYILDASQRPNKFGSTASKGPLSQTIEKGLVTAIGNRQKRL